MTSELVESRLICGDALLELAKLPAETVDLAVTSPPYNKQEKHKGHLVSNVVYDTFRDAMPEDEYQSNQIDVLNAAFRAVKPGGSFFYNHKIRWVEGELLHPMDWLRESDWNIRQEIVWDRTIAANIRGWRFWQVDERVYWLHKPENGDSIGEELAGEDAKMTSGWRGVPESGKEHPAPFPIWIPARVIISLLGTERSGLVLDPYLGGGTTAVAASLLGHRYIGIDISQSYVDMAKTRISSAASEASAVAAEASLHKKTMPQTEHSPPTLF